MNAIFMGLPFLIHEDKRQASLGNTIRTEQTDEFENRNRTSYCAPTIVIRLHADNARELKSELHVVQLSVEIDEFVYLG